ncbi:hypothetical protein Acr_26g0001070 [Actinidia rufa]|uniref:Transmembrane protein n=1 Tax=Actinidia rufa TaxID=165716 RepID=A0A7J0H135_9ERIC|nr:hypothetical protein Acr_26g0001070 [Actinidia rufa]
MVQWCCRNRSTARGAIRPAAVRFDHGCVLADGFWWRYGPLGFGNGVDIGVGVRGQWFGYWFCCGGLDFVFLVVVWVVVGVVWAVVMAAWAAVVAVQFGFGAGIMQDEGEGTGTWVCGYVYGG